MKNNKCKVLVYPFDMEFLSNARYLNEFDKIEVKYFLSPKGWKESVEKLLEVNNLKNKLNEHIYYEITDKMQLDYDAFMLVDSFMKLNYEEYILPYIKQAISKRKKIIINRVLSVNQFNEIEKLVRENGGELIDLSHRVSESFFTNQYLELSQINTPIVFVAGTTEQTNKFDLQLYLKEELSKVGYNVSLLGSRSGCELMGGHSYPKFMLDNTISELDKILYFNKFVKKIEQDENPDIIIIGIPGGTIPLDEKYRYMNCCISCFEISKSIKPDFVILSLSFDKYEEQYFDDIGNYMKNKYDFEVDCYHISNILPDSNSLRNLDLSYIIVPDNEVTDLMNKHYKNRKNVFSFHDSNNSKCMVSYLIDKLSEYDEVKFL